MRGSSDSHELPAEKITNVKVAKLHLCDLAYHHGKLYPDMCQSCKAVCRYGIRLLELMDLQHIRQEREIRIKDLSTQGKPLPTIHQRIKKRAK